ncbi:MAG TPA: RNA 2'-phosphotransferase [Mucilaginibacter sp.]
MPSEKETTKISGFLSLVLRHQPETIGLSLDENGWADVQILIEKINQHGFRVDLDTLNHIVAKCMPMALIPLYQRMAFG